MPDYNSYQKSISYELNAIKDRVRNFIDRNQWAEDGMYHEIILRDTIAEKLPSFASCGTGFVIGAYNRLSTQIDIIVYRNDMPLFFKKGDFIIVPQEAVLGIIEVKSKLCSSIIVDTLRKAHENGSLIDHNIFNGIFSYDDYTNADEFRISGVLKESLGNNAGKVNNISFGKDYFMKYWEDGYPYGQPDKKYRLYKIRDLSFGYFISNLIEDCYVLVNGQAISDTLKAVLYPIEDTKEAYERDTLYLKF